MNCKKLVLMIAYIIIGLVFHKDVTLFDRAGLTQTASAAHQDSGSNKL